MTEAITPYLVGHEYDVPVLTAQGIDGEPIAFTFGDNDFTYWLPLLNEFHRDEDFVDINKIGYHANVDWRFVDDRTIRCAIAKVNRVSTVVPYAFFALTVLSAGIVGKPIIETRRLICKRDWLGSIPLAIDGLNKKFCKAKLAGKCPHQGTPTERMIVYRGRIVCPAHGLAFNHDDRMLHPLMQGAVNGSRLPS
jgi:hypothetical protein